MSGLKTETLDRLNKTIAYFIDQPQNDPNSDFCKNVDELINIQADLHEVKANEPKKPTEQCNLPDVSVAVCKHCTDENGNNIGNFYICDFCGRKVD